MINFLYLLVNAIFCLIFIFYFLFTSIYVYTNLSKSYIRFNIFWMDTWIMQFIICFFTVTYTLCLINNSDPKDDNLNFSEFVGLIYFILIFQGINLNIVNIFKSILLVFTTKIENKEKLDFIQDDFYIPDSIIYPRNLNEELIFKKPLHYFFSVILFLSNVTCIYFFYSEEDKNLNIFTVFKYFLISLIFTLILIIILLNNTKNKIYDKDDNLVDEKFYIRGKLRVPDFIYGNLRMLNIFFEKNGVVKDFFKEKQILYSKEMKSVFNKKKCINCQKLIGKVDIYYCYFCKVFYCHKCAKKKISPEDDDGENECNYHSLLAILDVDKIKNVLIKINRLGMQMYSQYASLNIYDMGFVCSYCEDNDVKGRRYICLDCRGCDILMATSNQENEGYIDVCGSCYDLMVKYYQNPKKIKHPEKIKSLLDDVADRQDHHFDSHLYVMTKFRTGNYFEY